MSDPEKVRLSSWRTDGAAEGDGHVLRGGIPGELVEPIVDHVRKRDDTRFGRVGRVLEPAPSRVDVECAVFLECGGCDLLHTSIETQLEFKRAEVASALGLDLERVEPVVASDRTHGYRALAKLICDDAVLGSYKPRSHDVVDMRGCVVHAPEVERVIEALRVLIRKNDVDLRYALVRASLTEGRAVVTLVSHTEEATGIREVAKALFKRDDVGVVAHHVNRTSGNVLIGPEPIDVLHEDGEVVETIGVVPQRIEPGAFSQVNPLAAATLYRLAVEGMNASGRSVLDLYGGSGGLALSLIAAGASSVTSVETNAEACRAARATAERMKLADRLEVIEAPVEDELGRIGSADLVVLNPPRKGASEFVRERLADGDWERIVYVSCNPETLARDVEDIGGTVERVTPVDMFVHSRHVETVLVLKR